MRLLLVIAALVSTGCDKLFSLTPLPDAMRDSGACDPLAIPHDEDQDGIDDSCDNCPGTSNSDQKMSPGDSVGSACDPEPGLAGDTLGGFYSFAPSGPLGAFSPLGGDWAVTNDAYSNTDATLDVEDHSLSTALYAHPIGLEASVVIDTIGTSSGHLYKAGIEVLATNSDDGYACEVLRSSGSDYLLAYSNSGTAMTAIASSHLGPGAAYVIRLTAKAKTLACTLTGSGDTAAATATFTATLPASGSVGVYTDGETAHFPYLVVYQLAP